jgi:hypothetical protein
VQPLAYRNSKASLAPLYDDGGQKVFQCLAQQVFAGRLRSLSSWHPRHEVYSRSPWKGTRISTDAAMLNLSPYVRFNSGRKS